MGGPKARYSTWVNCTRAGCLGVAFKDRAYYFGGYSGHDGTIYLDEWLELNLEKYQWR